MCWAKKNVLGEKMCWVKKNVLGENKICVGRRLTDVLVSANL
jgi:hypothetical protein